MTLLFWCPLFAAIAHITEEFVWPGGFATWYRKYNPDIARSISTRYLVVVNSALLFACVSVGIDRPTSFGPAFLLTVVALLFGNGVFHLFATLRKKAYSPGVVTGVLLYIPLGIISFAAILRQQLATAETALIAAIVGCSYQVVSVANHRRRERALRAYGAGD